MKYRKPSKPSCRKRRNRTRAPVLVTKTETGRFTRYVKVKEKKEDE